MGLLQRIHEHLQRAGRLYIPNCWKLLVHLVARVLDPGEALTPGRRQEHSRASVRSPWSGDRGRAPAFPEFRSVGPDGRYAGPDVRAGGGPGGGGMGCRPGSPGRPTPTRWPPPARPHASNDACGHSRVGASRWLRWWTYRTLPRSRGRRWEPGARRRSHAAAKARLPARKFEVNLSELPTGSGVIFSRPFRPNRLAAPPSRPRPCRRSTPRRTRRRTTGSVGRRG